MKHKSFLAAAVVLFVVVASSLSVMAQGTPNEDVYQPPVQTVPDAGSTALLLGVALGAMAWARSRARK